MRDGAREFTHGGELIVTLHARLHLADSGHVVKDEHMSNALLAAVQQRGDGPTHEGHAPAEDLAGVLFVLTVELVFV